MSIHEQMCKIINLEKSEFIVFDKPRTKALKIA